MKNKTCFFGEMILRLTPCDLTRLECADTLEMNFGGSELNTAVLMKRLGEDVVYASLLPDSKIGENGIRFLQSNGIPVDYIHRSDKRLPLYFYEKGAEYLGGEVIYDRKNSCFSEMKEDEFDWETILDDCSCFHYSGITPALSGNAKSNLFRALETCRKKNIKVSCDVNYRKALWTPKTCSETMEKALSMTDICIINEEHADILFGIRSDKRDSYGELTDEGYTEIAEKLSEKFNFKYIALTIRRTISSNSNIVRGMLYKDGKSYFSKAYPVENIIDRIGGGDAFTAALLFKLKSDCDYEQAINFGVCANAIKHYIKGDCALTNEKEIESAMTGKGFRLGR